MKVQIMGRITTPTDCTLEVKLEGMMGYLKVALPTHEVLTEETLKAAIRTSIEQMAFIRERMAIVDTFKFQELDLD